MREWSGCGRLGFGTGPQKQPEESPGPLGRSGEITVVTDAREALGEDVLEPATDELVGMEVENAASARGAVGPAQQDVAFPVEAEQAPGAEGAAPDVAGEVADGGLAAADVPEMYVPVLAGAESVPGRGRECCVDIRVLLPDSRVDAAAEAGGERAVVDEEVCVFRSMKCGIGRMESEGGNDEMDVGVVLHLAPPGVEDGDAGGVVPLCLRRDDIAEGMGGLAQQKIVEFPRVPGTGGAEFPGNGEGDHEVGRREEPGLLPGAPDLLVERTALRAVPVVAAVVGEVIPAADPAPVEPASELRGAAGEDAAYRPVVGGTKLRGIGRPEGRPMRTQDACEGGRLHGARRELQDPARVRRAMRAFSSLISVRWR